MNRPPDRARNRSLAFSAVAIVAAAMAAPLLLSSLKQMSGEPAGQRRPVVVAAADLHPSQVLKATDLKLVNVPVDLVPKDGFANPELLVGRTVRQDVLEGEPMREHRLADATRGRGLHALIEPGMRAMAVRVDEQIGVSGFIQPNNFVDVVVAMRQRGVGSEVRARTVLQRVRVLAIGTETETRGNKAVAVSTVTLMVDPEQQEQLSMAINEGNVSLSLRNDVDLAMAETEGVSVGDIVGGAHKPVATRAPRREPVRAETKAEPPPTPTHEVEVYKGGLTEKRSFNAEEGTR